MVKNPPKQDTQETGVLSPGQENPLGKEVTTNSRVLAWETPWTEESGGYSPRGCRRAGHDLVTEQQNQKDKREIATRWKPQQPVKTTPCPRKTTNGVREPLHLDENEGAAGRRRGARRGAQRKQEPETLTLENEENLESASNSHLKKPNKKREKHPQQEGGTDKARGQ